MFDANLELFFLTTKKNRKKIKKSRVYSIFRCQEDVKIAFLMIYSQNSRIFAP